MNRWMRRSAAFMPLQRGQQFGVRLSVVVRTFKRRERRAPSPLVATPTTWTRLRGTGRTSGFYNFDQVMNLKFRAVELQLTHPWVIASLRDSSSHQVVLIE